MRHVGVHCRCIVYYDVYLMMCRIAKRNDRVIANALDSMARALHRQQNQAGDKLCGLGNFQRNNRLTFKGKYDLKGVQAWLKEIEKILRVMVDIEEQKVLFGTHMLSKEAKD